MAKREISSREKSLRRYFGPKRRRLRWLVLLVAGAVVAAVSTTIYEDWAALLFLGGAAAAVLGLLGFIASLFTGGAPGDGTVDKWFNQGIDKVVDASLAKLNLDKNEIELDPIVIRAPVMWDTYGIDGGDLLAKEGKDKEWRFGVYEVVVIHLTQRLLAAYSCDYNFLRDVMLNEETDEYHYTDIVTVSTKELASSLTLPTGSKLTRVQMFKVTVSSGDSVEVIINADKISALTGPDRIPETGAERAVNVIRSMLREKKP